MNAINNTARESWAALNVDTNSAEELKATLALADSGDWSAADADIENYNSNAVDGQPLLTRRDWFLGIEEAIEAIEA